MKKIYYRKLIRDKIPEIINSKGGEFKTRILLKGEFEKELRKKLLEESKELLKAPRKDLVNELSDVLEVLKSIASYYKISFKKIEKYQIKKRKERGGFKKRLFLVWSSDK
ncbi:nucleoside triphosphate pyrophosphohydrolase [Patescibacteria group bacterium]|nr:nucleoside triphosphate pyrophosphohydrolase [Patescibacteria group bacterium]MBU0777056.1 nucleoside triphosphate pyrophosphohydrolase [Patescibacteria group bacterium]MBU0845750.1 nucleoside triphosphate pyrophosphohydrolase [Patescibacteria group bacterium]MBU0923200.1 nucleoside triphosphate pyrophosphohydrolase [Patescibacteria group bacterium]MBU1066490.1 nucleoside triphosphate pyrophosphohydrolase [Patescibacteria group bacterium]